MRTTEVEGTTQQENKAIAKFTDMKADGASNADAIKAGNKIQKTNPSKYYRAWYGDARNPNGTKPFEGWHALTEDQKDAIVTQWRVEEGLSWGYISVRAHGEAESKCRTRWERGSKFASTGHRVGKGGRFAFGAKELYEGNHKGLGTELSREELRELRNDPEKLAKYLAEADEYKTKAKARAQAAKRKLQAKRSSKKVAKPEADAA